MGATIVGNVIATSVFFFPKLILWFIWVFSFSLTLQQMLAGEEPSQFFLRVTGVLATSLTRPLPPLTSSVGRRCACPTQIADTVILTVMNTVLHWFAVDCTLYLVYVLVYMNSANTVNKHRETIKKQVLIHDAHSCNHTIRRIGPFYWLFGHQIHMSNCVLTCYSSPVPIVLYLFLVTFCSPQVSLSLSLFLKVCICIKRDFFLSPDTNLHKVDAINGSREANYFPGNITLSPSFIIYSFLTWLNLGLVRTV